MFVYNKYEVNYLVVVNLVYILIVMVSVRIVICYIGVSVLDMLFIVVFFGWVKFDSGFFVWVELDFGYCLVFVDLYIVWV